MATILCAQDMQLHYIGTYGAGGIDEEEILMDEARNPRNISIRKPTLGEAYTWPQACATIPTLWQVEVWDWWLKIANLVARAAVDDDNGTDLAKICAEHADDLNDMLGLACDRYGIDIDDWRIPLGPIAQESGDIYCIDYQEI